MLKISAHDYLELGRNLESLSAMLALDKSLDEHEVKDEIRAELEGLYLHCMQLKLGTASGLVDRALRNPPKTAGELEIYLDAVEIELQQRLFFFVLPHRAGFYDQRFDDKLTRAFPKACAELGRAGNCYSFGEYTAAVFHAMRACEISLRVLASELQITLSPLISGWHNIIDQIESKIKAMEQLQKSQQRDTDLQFFSGAAAQFRYFKEAWRNHVSHAKELYVEGQALTAVEHSRALIEALSGRLAEPSV
jgi:hypothetical protein